MKKSMIYFTILSLATFAFYIVYNIYYPTFVATAVVHEKYINLLPESYDQNLSISNDTINITVDKVIITSAENGITIAQLEAAITEIKMSDIELIYNKIKSINIISTEQVFDTIVTNIQLKSLNLKSLREPFLDHVQKQHIREALKYIETNDLFNTIDEKSARLIAIEILKQKKDQINEQLKQIK